MSTRSLSAILVCLCGLCMLCIAQETRQSTVPATRSVDVLSDLLLPDCSAISSIEENPVVYRRLLRQLAANSSWRVEEERGAVVASKKNPEVRIPPQQNELTLRIIFGSFNRGPADSRRIELTCSVAAGTRTAKLPLRKNSRETPEVFDSILVIRATEGEIPLFLEISESSPDRDRAKTQVALANIIKELNVFIEHHEQVEKEGCVPTITPAGSFSDTEQEGLQVTPATGDFAQEGMYRLSAWINPGQMGYVTIEVVDSSSGKPVAIDRVPPRYVGWTPDRKRKFVFDTGLSLTQADASHSQHRVEFRLIFHPVESRLLLKADETVIFWRR